MLKQKPVFSVIIPTYNRAHILNRSVNSVLNQTFNDFELLIVDDGSKDNTEEVIRGYDDERIIYIKHKINQGQNPALNTGLANAKGTYISFLDSDDEWLPEMLEKQYKKFQESGEYDCVYCRCIGIDASGNKVNGHNFQLEGYIYKEALKQGYVSSMVSLSAKRSCFEEIGNFDINFKNCQDDDICLRLAKKYCFALIKERLVIVHSDGGGQVTSDNAEYAVGWLKLINKHQEDIKSLCGKGTLAKHYMKCAKLFLLAKQREKAREAAIKSLNFKYTPKGIIVFGLSYFPISVFTFSNKLISNLKFIY